ncbi:MAG TPA: RagB/SusD family nutrient uptake outer membrane protein [Gemmatimonadaceae bacterium]|nr:RagB/SusD family nutrient uptake outer membrane protein [Gemmatimonadaceae bacterium]
MTHRKLALLAAAAAGFVLAACDPDLTVPNYNSPTKAQIDADPQRIQLLANGIMNQLAAQAPAYIDDLGTLGRESFEYTPTEGRNHTNFVQAATLTNSGFAAGLWAGRYTNVRNVREFLRAVDEVQFLPGGLQITDQQRSAARGFAKTIEALELLYAVSTRDTLGIPVEVKPDIAFIAPFVTRDSAYKYITGRLDEAVNDLKGLFTVVPKTGGGADTVYAQFPFVLNMELRGVTAKSGPEAFRKFNRAILARALAYRGSLGCAACYQRVITLLNNTDSTFFNPNPGSRAGLDVGVYNLYSTAPGATQNTLSPATTTGSLRYAHPSIILDTAATRDARGRSVYPDTNVERAHDQRVLAKIRVLPASVGPSSQNNGIRTQVGFAHYPLGNSPIPIIRNEELILLRAEAYAMTGSLGLATQDINTIRTVSGGQPTIGTLADQPSAIIELLKQRRLSLLYEGHRIIDLRRFGRIDQEIPLDKMRVDPDFTQQHYRHSVMPIPQAECLNRAIQPDLLPPSCK